MKITPFPLLLPQLEKQVQTLELDTDIELSLYNSAFVQIVRIKYNLTWSLIFITIIKQNIVNKIIFVIITFHQLKSRYNLMFHLLQQF